MSAELEGLVDAELRRAVAPEVTVLASRLAGRAGPSTAAVLFYGSGLRDEALDGVLDFYVLTDRPIAWPGSWFTALLGRWLPPNVGYLEAEVDGVRLRAKYAVLTVRQFRDAMSPRRLDTTLWARFSQPCAVVHMRRDEDFRQVRSAVAQAIVTAASWAAELGPPRGPAAGFWRALYRRTYAAELRVESGARGDALLAGDARRYEALLPAAWRSRGLAFDSLPDGTLQPGLDASQREAAGRRWSWRQRLGGPLNLLRLLKAATTFDNAIDYVAWKVERHSGYRIEPSPFQRRHPLLAAPLLYWRLRARGVLR